jgi:hypothetical protein
VRKSELTREKQRLLWEAINTYSNPYEFVAPILEIIADNPSVDFGMPGELVHFVEQFYKNGYEELLIASVSEKPTPHNIWMLHRCYNDIYTNFVSATSFPSLLSFLPYFISY